MNPSPFQPISTEQRAWSDFKTWVTTVQDFIPEAMAQKYGTSGPRYTSYPTAPVWTEAFNSHTLRQVLQETNQPGHPVVQMPLSLYTHLPFCEARCHFCGCNVVITQQKEQAEKYLGYLFKDIDQMAALVDTQRPVIQYHWGGGTPTYLSCDQMERLFQKHQEHFTFHPDAEIAIEVDPRVTTEEQLKTLRALGFNRVSMGVQDIEPTVQEAINRVQPLAQTEAQVEACRELGFEGINLDLIYGLPHQTVQSFERTLREIIRLKPDRIALYNYAHVPWISPHQNLMDASALPKGDVKLQIFRLAMEMLVSAGYVYIGMDHFAKPADELSQAMWNGTLHRNFMGYTTRSGSEMLAFGVSGISNLQGAYAQNVKKLSTYYKALDDNELPTWRGYTLSQDDQIRKTVIQTLLCQSALDFSSIETAVTVDTLGSPHGEFAFNDYFKDALEALNNGPIPDGLVQKTATGLELTPLGRILARNVAMPFDAYLQAQRQSEKPLFSQTV